MSHVPEPADGVVAAGGWTALVVLPVIADPTLRAAWATRRSLGRRGPERGGYQVGGLWVGRAVGWMTGLGSGGVVVAVAVTAWGEEAFDDAFEARYALGQGLQVLAHVGQAAADFGQAGVDFHSQRLRIGAGVAPEGQQQPDHCGAHADQGGSDGEDSDEFGGHGRLHSAQVYCVRPGVDTLAGTRERRIEPA